MSYQSGFVAIIGAPNVGKSTLMNALLGQKISIVSPKPQTTRNRILGVKHLPGGQIIFLDTPGIFSATSLLDRGLVQAALKTLSEVNLVLLMIEPFSGMVQIPETAAGRLKIMETPVFLIINKVDLVDKEKLLPLIEKGTQAFPFKEIIPLSALTGDGLALLVREILALLPEGPQYFPEDMITDLPEQFLVEELIREKVFRLLSKEVPYAAAVTVDSFRRREDKPIIHIQATIHVERDSQKGILIGKGGLLLKKIGQSARESMEPLLGSQVFLELWVRVEKNWRKNPKLIKRFGYEGER
jgi:GTP-binding protein Era